MGVASVPVHSHALFQVPYIHPDITHTPKHTGMEWKPHHIMDGSLEKEKNNNN